MLIFPAIDLYGGKAVRLYKGDYEQMTVYSDDPLSVARDFERAGASWVHLVDLEGAKLGTTPNIETVRNIASRTSLLCEIGGGIRNMQTVESYFDAGVSRVILGTAAVTDRAFLEAAVAKYGDKIAVGVDIKDTKVAIRGWLEKSEYDAFDFCADMQRLGVKTVICTDISKDGAMRGANHALYRELSEKFSMQIVASGGVSSLDDVNILADLGIYGAIIGKAYYTGAIELSRAIEVAK
ncbi:MAG: 1-(5-phosphoribosyl)-5-[(5-phosphoribosylamino)methylideneamino]imidazole-4-carboxamide isomerase [Ruminococcaceae bacterium]|nr:1-(5-phosphoribosyl)-5-[(5-phosphoribosylamino)methylideneamino]imidazole-4-carboxamide isomerase [Oscillospiraceae bacterium]